MFWNFAVGPMREYQEKFQKFLKTFWNFQKSGLALASLSHPFLKAMVQNFPEYCSKTTLESFKPKKWLEEWNRYLKFLDQCWAKVMHSDAYAEKTARFMEAMVEFQGSSQDLTQILCASFPWASKKDVEILADQIQKIRQHLRRSETCEDGK